MKVTIEHEIKASDIELTEQELLENFIKQDNRYSMHKIADKALSEVSWHKNMPKSSKLWYINMLSNHIEAFMENINYNDDLSEGNEA